MYLIANGGLATHNQNNTMDAILLTKNTSYVDGVLLDVRLTLDNKIVLFRNNDLSIDTLGEGLISETLYKNLRKVKFPSKIFKYYIPTLEELLKVYQSKKTIILNIHPIENKNEILVLELFKILNQYPDYNFFLETISKEVLDYLILYGPNYKIGMRLSTAPPKCNGETSFCDIANKLYDANINTYSSILIHTINSHAELMESLKYIDQNKLQDLYIITDNPYKLKKYLHSTD